MNTPSARLIVILLAVVSVLTTSLVVLNVMANRQGSAPADAQAQDTLRGGVITPQPIDDMPLDLPVLYQTSEFSLIDQSGRTFGSADLHGKVWVAGFIFTRCQTVCPRLTSQMAVLHSRVAVREQGMGDVMFVSFSVNPRYDRPDVLSRYWTMATAQPESAPAAEQWRFLTGEREPMWELIGKGFRLPVAEDPGNLRMPIVHTDRLMLVDKLGRIRGYYEALTADGDPNDEALAELMSDIERLEAEPAPPALDVVPSDDAPAADPNTADALPTSPEPEE